jgi:tetratricopeptide (TPR) repeat protein
LLAGELFSFMLSKDEIAEAFNQYWPYYEAEIINGMEISDETRLKLDNLKIRIKDNIVMGLNSEPIENEFVNIFANVFNQEELNALATFYSTPVGKSILGKYPVLRLQLSSAMEKIFSEKIELFDHEIEDIFMSIKLSETDDHQLLGDYYLNKNNHMKAIEEYTKAIQLDENNPNALNNLAWALVSCPENSCYDPQKAILLSKKALKIREAPYIYDTLAVAYAETGKFKEAVGIMKYIIDRKKEYEIEEKELDYYEKCLKSYERKKTCK